MADKGKVVPLPDAETLETEAAEWLVRLDGDAVSAETKAAFLAWRNQTEQHREAALKIANVWGGLDCLDEFNDHAVCAENQEARRVDRAGGDPVFERRRFMAAASVAVVLAAGAIFMNLQTPSQRFETEYRTAIGVQETISLPDGSEILLNTDSKIEIAYANDRRSVRLLRGEAFFEVAKDETRPFSVASEAGTVTAIGTAFSVRLRDEKLDVLVSKGRVALSQAAFSEETPTAQSGGEPLAELIAGQGAVFAEAVERVEQLAPEDVDRKLSWRDGILTFSGESLAEVVADISRYTEVRIDIADGDLGALPIAGYFPVGEVDAMFEALEIMADVNVAHLSDRHVLLSREN